MAFPPLYSHGTDDRKLADTLAGVYSSQCLLDVDHGFCYDQVHTCVTEIADLFLIDFEGFFVSHVTGRCHHLAGGGDITCY